MRDPNRIDPFLETLADLWKQYPDMRFGQLVMNLTRGEGGFLDPWNWEEDVWIDRINKFRQEYPPAADEAMSRGLDKRIADLIDRYASPPVDEYAPADLDIADLRVDPAYKRDRR